MTSRPAETEYAVYYERYVSLVPESDIVTALKDQSAQVQRIGSIVEPGRDRYRYAEGKWSVREVVGHMIDAERVFGYRAFCISRRESAPLPSFDEKPYVEHSIYDQRPLVELLEEFVLVRNSNLAFLVRLTDPQWMTLGIASGNPVSVRALAYMMVGHVRHHLNVLRNRYGLSL